MFDEPDGQNGIPTGPRAVDAAGGSVPFTDEERRARVAAWDQTVRELEAMTDETDTDEIWDEVLQATSASTPPPVGGSNLDPARRA